MEGVSPNESGKQTPSKVLDGRSSKKTVVEKPEDIQQGVVAAFLATRNGYSVDRVVADPEMNERFVEMCHRLGLPGTAPRWNRLIMNLRKRSYFKGGLRSKRTIFHDEETDKYSFACEIAIQTLAERDGSSLDDILCDPTLAAEFDRMVFAIAHKNILPLKARWTALGMRKRLRESLKIMHVN